MEKFIDEASTPLVTLFEQSAENQPFLSKYFSSSSDSKVQFLYTKILITYYTKYIFSDRIKELIVNKICFVCLGYALPKL